MGDSFSMDSSWEEGAEEVKEYKCRECGKAISHSNKSGLCHSCIIKIKMKKSTRVCKIEGCNEKITTWNKSGLCTYHHHRMRNRRRYYKEFKRNKPMIKHVGKMGVCRKCKAIFELEWWQHSTLHWCPACQNSEIYKNYIYVERINGGRNETGKIL